MQTSTRVCSLALEKTRHSKYRHRETHVHRHNGVPRAFTMTHTHTHPNRETPHTRLRPGYTDAHKDTQSQTWSYRPRRRSHRTGQTPARSVHRNVPKRMRSPTRLWPDSPPTDPYLPSSGSQTGCLVTGCLLAPDRYPVPAMTSSGSRGWPAFGAWEECGVWGLGFSERP